MVVIVVAVAVIIVVVAVIVVVVVAVFVVVVVVVVVVAVVAVAVIIVAVVVIFVVEAVVAVFVVVVIFYYSILLQIFVTLYFPRLFYFSQHRSEQYVLKVAALLGDRVHLNKKISSITRTATKAKNGSQGEAEEAEVVTVVDEKGVTHVFDKIVFACHPDQVLLNRTLRLFSRALCSVRKR